MRRIFFIGFLSMVLAACGMIFSDHKVSKISHRSIIKSQGCIGPPPECMGGSDGGGDDDGE
jgi:hypothetical protein